MDTLIGRKGEDACQRGQRLATEDTERNENRKESKRKSSNLKLIQAFGFQPGCASDGCSYREKEEDACHRGHREHRGKREWKRIQENELES
jgi:hypothetical protein